MHTLADLQSRDILDAGSDKPARLAVIGFPVAHSASPAMHQPALDEAGIDARYIKLEVPVGHAAEAFAGMRALGFIGTNVTVPHKFDALDYCTHLDPEARILGAVNTIVFREDGIHGFNTDGPGFTRAVKEEFGVDLADLRVLIVGAGGGAGQALAAQCALLGVPKLVLANRSTDKLTELSSRLVELLDSARISCFALDDPDLIAAAKECDLIINTTSIGLKAEDPSSLDPRAFTASHLVYDTIYQPPRTAFLAVAQAAGAKIANGRSMLLHQGVLAFQHWFPGTEPLEAMRTGLAAAEAAKK